MSFKKQYIEWEVPSSSIQYGIPIGFEVECSDNSLFSPKTYRLTTFEESHEHYGSRFYYSLDNKATWILYPYGDSGLAFYQSFYMRLELNANNSGFVVAISGDQIYKVSADCRETLDSMSIGTNNISDTSFGKKSDVFYASNSDTLYRIASNPSLCPYDNSLDVDGENILGIAVDEERDTFWQINRRDVCLKNLYGEEIYCLKIPFDIEIDIDYSSSSSS